jgi:ribosomal protein S18 acetylase RimI-like enzyme
MPITIRTAREQGIGHQLLIAAQERAVADGKSRVDLTTAKTNFKAQSLYQALGWEKDEIFYTYAWFSKE